jgi:hypothetical protein
MLCAVQTSQAGQWRQTRHFPQLLGQTSDSRPTMGQYHAGGTQLACLTSDSLSADELQLHGGVCLVHECVVVVHGCAFAAQCSHMSLTPQDLGAVI